MSTKQTTSGIFNQPSMNAFNTMTPTASSALMSNITDPYSNMFFNTQLAMGQQQNAGYMNTMNANTLQNLQANGMSYSSPMAMYMMRRNAMQGSQMNSGMYNNLLLNAANLRQQSISGALNYRPLQTGQTQQTGGLGSWLPQLAGTAMGAAGAAIGGLGSGGAASPAFSQAGPGGSWFANVPGNTSGLTGALNMAQRIQPTTPSIGQNLFFPGE